MKSTYKILLVLAIWSPGGQAATLDVNSLADSVDPMDGACTLREAVTAANTDMQSGGVGGECVAGSGDDRITFSTAAGTISLGSSLPTITEGLEIVGPSDTSIVISGATTFNLLEADDGTSTRIPVAVRRLTFSGGAVAVFGSDERLHVDACLIEGAGVGVGSAFNGSLLLTNSTVSGCLSLGQGAVAASNAVVINSTITANARGLQGILSLINTVVAGNARDCTGSVGLPTFLSNFIGDTTCNFAPVDNQGDPMLLSLADNGGSTRTHGLDIGSPLRDAGILGACPSTDQRGGDRAADGDGVGGAECDIGAVEVADSVSTAVYLESFSVD